MSESPLTPTRPPARPGRSSRSGRSGPPGDGPSAGPRRRGPRPAAPPRRPDALQEGRFFGPPRAGPDRRRRPDRRRFQRGRRAQPENEPRAVPPLPARRQGGPDQRARVPRGRPGLLGGLGPFRQQPDDDLVRPTVDTARVIGAVAKGDLSQTMDLESDGRPLQGEFLRTARTVNTMVHQLGSFASEVTRVAREVGTEGKLGGQAKVKGVAGTWKDLTENVNLMAGNLTGQVRNIAAVTTAVAKGDLAKKITVDVKGEFLELKATINTMVDQLRSFASEVTRVAREVGTEGKLGGQARVEGVSGTWKDLTDSVNFMAGNLTSQVRNIADVTKAVAQGDLSKKITVDVEGEILELKNTVNTMVDQLSSFAAEVTRVAREVGTEGKLGGQADVPGVAGTWKDLTDNVNFMAGNLTSQVRNIADVTTAVANGDLSKKITVDVRGEILELKDTINTMVDQLRSFASEVTRVAREVGTEGKLGGQADVRGVAGTWKDLTDNVNFMAGNLTSQVRNIADVTKAVAKGDLSKKITVDVKGEILELKNTVNTMVDQLSSFAAEVTRVAREVGTEGKLGGQAQVEGVSGTWKDLTDSVNSMAGNLTSQVRNIADVTTAVAKGDLGKKITVDVKGEILELKNTVNTMVDQLRSFASEVTRVAREVGTEGKLGGQADVRDVAGTWKDLTDSVNFMAGNLTSQVRNIAEVTTAVAKGDLSKKITVDVRGEILELKNTINTMVDQLSLVCGRGHARGARGRHGRQARRPGRRAGSRRHLEGPHRQRQLHGRQPDVAGAQHRRRHEGRGQGRPRQEDHGRRQGRDPGAEEHGQHDGRPALLVRGRGHARGARGRHGRQARRPGHGARSLGHLEGPHGQRQLDGQQPDVPGPRHRPGRDRGRERRSAPQADPRGQGRDRRAGGHDQRHERHAGDLCGPGHDRGPRGRRRGPARRPGERPGRRRHLEGPHGQREPAGREPDDAGPRHRRGRDRRDQGRPDAVDQGRGGGRGRGAQGQHQRDDPQPQGHDAQEHRDRLAEDQPGQVLAHAPGAARPPRGRPADPLRARARRLRPPGRLLHARRQPGRTAAQAPGELCLRRGRPQSDAEARRRPHRPVRGGEAEDLPGSGARRLPLDLVGPRQVDACEHHGPADPLRGRGQGRARAGRLQAVQPGARGAPRAADGVDRHRSPDDRVQHAHGRPPDAVPVPRRRAAVPAGRAATDQPAARGEGGPPGRAQRRGREEEPGSRAGPPRPGGEGPPADADLEVQVRVPREHVARAPDAPEQPADPLGPALPQPRRQPLAQADRVLEDDPRVGQGPAGAHQRHPGPLEDRVRHGRGGRRRAAPGRSPRLRGPDVPARRRGAEARVPDRHEPAADAIAHDRHEEAPAGHQEPSLQRLQVHGAGPCGPAPRDRRRRLDARHQVPRPRGLGHRHLGDRHRDRHSGRQAADHLRGLPAGRRQHEPEVRRHGPRARHQPRDRAASGRRDPARERSGPGQHVHAVRSGNLRGRCR